MLYAMIHQMSLRNSGSFIMYKIRKSLYMQ